MSKKVAFLVAGEGIERSELVEPWEAIDTAGHEPVLLSVESGTVRLFNHLEAADTRDVDVVVTDAKVDEFDALVLPGGVANPDALRMNSDAVAFVRDMVASGKPVAAICHAPWMLAEADVLEGRRVTSFDSIKTDLKNAGATWVDDKVVADGNVITSRNPDDLPAFNSAIIEALEHGVAATPET